MASWTRAARRLRWWAPVVLVSLALVACGGTSEQYPQSTLHPKADFARILDGVFMNTVWAAVVVFVLVEGALLWVMWRYRGKPGDAEPAQVHGNTLLEIIWTAIPALLLAIIAVPTVRAIFETYEVPAGDALVVEVIGHQWWWEFRYPEQGLVTANELHVPKGRTVTLKMKTKDVLHSFWIPQLAGKRDVFANRTTTLWFNADSTGYYSGQCAEFCGIQHGKMAFHVVVETPAEFDAYVAGLQATAPPAPADSAAPSPAAPAAGASAAASGPAGDTTVTTLAAQAPVEAQADSGAKLFQARCTICHSLNAMDPRENMIGPNLANVGSRRHIAAGTLLNTDANLAAWIHDPQKIKVGVLMQNLGLTTEQAAMVAAYLRTHR
jgi:cytochrome c oxidase subunit 2